MNPKKIDIQNGTRFGMLVVLGEGEPRYTKPKIKGNHKQFIRTLKCVCDCGKVRDVRVAYITRARTTSCGCKSKKWSGDSQNHRLLYGVWRTMKDRCDGKIKRSPLYKLNGIKVCEEWSKDFFTFRDWSLKNGYMIGLTIDRIDGSKGYYPENCRWVTPEINCNNRDVTFYVNYQGTQEPIKLLLKRLNKCEMYRSVMDRIKRGWNHDLAVDTPIRKRKLPKRGKSLQQKKTSKPPNGIDRNL